MKTGIFNSFHYIGRKQGYLIDFITLDENLVIINRLYGLGLKTMAFSIDFPVLNEHCGIFNRFITWDQNDDIFKGSHQKKSTVPSIDFTAEDMCYCMKKSIVYALVVEFMTTLTCGMSSVNFGLLLIDKWKFCIWLKIQIIPLYFHLYWLTHVGLSTTFDIIDLDYHWSK